MYEVWYEAGYVGDLCYCIRCNDTNMLVWTTLKKVNRVSLGDMSIHTYDITLDPLCKLIFTCEAFEECKAYVQMHQLLEPDDV